MVVNLHARRIRADQAVIGELLDSLGGAHDRLWPRYWPPMRLDLTPGAVGGHGPVRYRVEDHVPGRLLRCRFLRPRGFDGYHEFSVRPGPDGTSELRHVIVVRLRRSAMLTYPLFWRPAHDAALEDLLDRAEREATGTVARPARWSPYVRLLRALA
ncbi:MULTISPECIES: hypothetical protein [Amycolatopsis]|uniref:SRPBCC family protein n=1 Tax=Amycolatopsis thermalba TaxID=944492 RepID=A0ABY4P2W9_9PSEU|nr:MULTISPECIES: hypothetical protein [Amycolatopsis]OXM73683.1 hypothetical protein CF166_08310 [Amycolatopsis sp. KNN50.9b]UQS26710.1 SRPBCC family protein [Amycolatopsis thermalba]